MVCNTRREESFWRPSLRAQIAVELMLTGNGENNTVYQTSVPSLTLLFCFISLSFKFKTQIHKLHELKAGNVTLTVWPTAPPSISVLKEHKSLSSGFSKTGPSDSLIFPFNPNTTVSGSSFSMHAVFNRNPNTSMSNQ